MSDFLYYILQVSIVFAVFYLFHRLCFNRLTFHNVNRAFMLIMLPLSLIIPLIDIELTSNYILKNTAAPMLFDDFGYIGGNIQQTEVINNSNLDFYAIVMLLYGIGVLTCLIRLILNAIKIVNIKHLSSSYADGKFRIINTDMPLVFSCFKWIFIPINKKSGIDNSIIEHEKLHGKAWHTLDLCVTELFVTLLWFNPFVYLFRRDLKIVHEYQVDSMLLHGDVKKSDYLHLILNNLVASHKSLGLCNYFNGLTIKKRVIMITKYKSSKWQLLSYLLIVPIIAIMTMSFSSSTNIDGDIPSISPIKVGEYKRISSEFGMRIHPIYKVEKFHGGIDFSAKEGTKIMATANGVVTTVEFKKDTYGKMIVINHGGGYETWYTQLSDYAVRQGDKVKQGDVIGYVGSSGLSTIAHLHYEVRKDGKPVNPQDYIKE